MVATTWRPKSQAEGAADWTDFNLLHSAHGGQIDFEQYHGMIDEVKAAVLLNDPHASLLVFTSHPDDPHDYSSTELARFKL